MLIEILIRWHFEWMQYSRSVLNIEFIENMPRSLSKKQVRQINTGMNTFIGLMFAVLIALSTTLRVDYMGLIFWSAVTFFSTFYCILMQATLKNLTYFFEMIEYSGFDK